MNKSKEDIIKFKQSKIIEASYDLLNMQAYMHIGKVRKAQEDSILLLSHPDNINFKLMALADGMGGLENGSLASNIALKEVLLWFEKIDGTLFYDFNKLSNDLDNKLNDIDQKIRKKCGEGGTTISIAIIGEKNTLFVNVGDSRIYISHNDNLIQLTKDQSLSWKLFEKGIIVKKDDIRFHKKNNLIFSKLGGKTKLMTIDKVIKTNLTYDKIFLFTDGVTDCLSDLEIEKIIKKSEKNNLAKAIVSAALDNNEDRADLNEDYYDKIVGGKDNATAAILIKR